MNYAIEARKLANYINELGESFITYAPSNQIVYDHIGALFADIILQSGLNYSTVVKPRVDFILYHYPEAKTVNSFKKLIDQIGAENVLRWQNHVKVERVHRLVNFIKDEQIETCEDLIQYLSWQANQAKLLDLNGIGPKTLDYLMKLLNFDTIAVDRHIFGFTKLANINSDDYFTVKKIVEYAADFLEISRRSIDYSIWKYMSNKHHKKKSVQVSLFN
jgi:hypothetical protein